MPWEAVFKREGLAKRVRLRDAEEGGGNTDLSPRRGRERRQWHRKTTEVAGGSAWRSRSGAKKFTLQKAAGPEEEKEKDDCHLSTKRKPISQSWMLKRNIKGANQ